MSGAVAPPPPPPPPPVAAPVVTPGIAAFNERTKVTATFVNTLAAALMTVGVLAPAAGVLNPTRMEPVLLPDFGRIVLGIGAWSVSALILHLMARWVAGQVR